MGDIRKMTSEDIENPKVRALMEKFWESYDKLYEDMDNLTYEEFRERESDMWDYRNRASSIDGNYFLISLYGMANKAQRLYGDEMNRIERLPSRVRRRKPIIDPETGQINIKYSLVPESDFKWYMWRFWKKVKRNFKKILRNT